MSMHDKEVNKDESSRRNEIRLIRLGWVLVVGCCSDRGITCIDRRLIGFAQFTGVGGRIE
jgi:hypothetical protein